MNDSITTDLRFSIVPAWVLDSGISDRAIRLYAVLAGYADSETGQAFPGRTLLSRRLDCSLKTIDRAVAELLAAGAVRKRQRVKDGHYQSSVYTVVRIDPGSGETRPRVMDDATPRHTRRDPVSPVTHRTITTELEPLKQEPLNKPKTMTADDYQPSPELLEELGGKFPHVSLDVELEKFRDHHMAKGSKFSIWDRAFRKWISQAAEWSKPARNTQRERPLTNNQRAALLAMKYREEAQRERELEAPVNPEQVKQITDDATSWLKGLDDD
jgi:hypothetical protein